MAAPAFNGTPIQATFTPSTTGSNTATFTTTVANCWIVVDVFLSQSSGNTITSVTATGLTTASYTDLPSRRWRFGAAGPTELTDLMTGRG